MKLMTQMYMPGSNNRLQLHQFFEEDIKLKTLENAEDISQHDSYTYFGFIEWTTKNDSYIELIEYYGIHEKSNNDLFKRWIQLMRIQSDFTNELVTPPSTAIRMTAPDPIVDEVPDNL